MLEMTVILSLTKYNPIKCVIIFQWIVMVKELKEYDSRKLTVGKRFHAELDVILYGES